MSEKVERINEGSSNDFSAIHGKGKAGTGPAPKNYSDKEAIAKWPPKKDNK